MSHPRLLIAAAATIAMAAPAVAQTTTCPNAATNLHALPDLGGVAHIPLLSADGLKVAFSWNTINGGNYEVWVRDLVTGAAVRASVNSAGQIANGHSIASHFSADGRWVAFHSDASNLAPGDTNGQFDAFRHDLATGATIRVSVDSAGQQANVQSVPSEMSADGRFVLFETAAPLAPTDTNTRWDVYMRDCLVGTTIHVSLRTGGLSSSGDCWESSISADGQRVVFQGEADDLVPGDSNGSRDVFLRDLAGNTTQLVSSATSGASGNGASRKPTISGDGQHVAFTSSATNLTSPPTTNGPHVFVRDLVNATTTMIDVNTSGTAPSHVVSDRELDIGHDGRFVAFASAATNLIAGDTNQQEDVFVRDTLLGVTVRASLGAVGQQANSLSINGSLSDDGSVVAFETEAGNLVPGDGQSWDVFVHEFAATAPGAPFCFGDGSGAACPCGNNGSPGHGCRHATSTHGAELFVMGEASITNDTLHLGAGNLPQLPRGIFLQGTGTFGGGFGVPFGDGLRCVGGSVVRLSPLLTFAWYEAHYPDVGQPPISVRGQLPAAATTRYYQAWFRSAGSYCTASTFNLSNAVRIDWTL